METGVQHYAVDLVRRTRSHPFIHYGASPRASVALLLCAKALAALRGREFSTPDDVRDVARPVLRHRLTLRAEAELDGATSDTVISDILRARKSRDRNVSKLGHYPPSRSGQPLQELQNEPILRPLEDSLI